MRTPFTMDSAGFLALLDALERRFNEVTATASLSFAGIDGDLHPVVQPARAGEEDCADRGESADFAQSAGAEDSAQSEPTVPCPGARCDSELRSPASTPLSCDFHGRTGVLHDEVFDPQLVELASSAFGSTCWASLMCVASLGLDAALVECARQFLTHTSIIVRQKGLAVWLYDLINDATMAMLLGQTSPRMLVTIRPMSQVQISRWLHGSGVKRFGSQQQRAADRAEYGNQAHRLAAYCMLRWGAPTVSSAQIATMLLTNPGIGMCMLREDPNVRAQGACTDTRYRRVVEYLRSLHAQADLDYARALKIGDVPWLSPDGHAAVTIAADRRYLYDANRLVHAYRALWDRATADPAQLLMAVEETRTLPGEPLWENPVYLRDLADSLMGSVLAEDLTMGFQQRTPRTLRLRGAHARAHGRPGARDERADAADHGDRRMRTRLECRGRARVQGAHNAMARVLRPLRRLGHRGAGPTAGAGRGVPCARRGEPAQAVASRILRARAAAVRAGDRAARGARTGCCGGERRRGRA